MALTSGIIEVVVVEPEGKTPTQADNAIRRLSELGILYAAQQVILLMGSNEPDGRDVRSFELR